MGETSVFWMCPLSSVYLRGITFPGSEYSSVTTGENTEGQQKYISLAWAVLSPNKSAITRGKGLESWGTWLWGATSLYCYWRWDDPNSIATSRTWHWANIISWFGGRTELIDFWLPWTWLVDRKGTYDSWTHVLRDDNLQGTRGGSWTEKSLSGSPCPYFYHYEPPPCTGKKLLRLENEMDHENHGSITLFLDLVLVVFSCIDSGLRGCMVCNSMESGDPHGRIMWTISDDPEGHWVLVSLDVSYIEGLLGLRDSGWYFSIFLMSLCPRLGIFWNTINKC